MACHAPVVRRDDRYEIYGTTINMNAREIYQREIEIQDRLRGTVIGTPIIDRIIVDDPDIGDPVVIGTPVIGDQVVVGTPVIGTPVIDNPVGPTFDAEKLHVKIAEIRVVEEDENHFPHFHVHAGESIEPFETVGARFVSTTCRGMDRSTLMGWLHNDTEEIFHQSCAVLAREHGVKAKLVEVAIWLMNAYYMDGESDTMDTISFDQARELYGIRDIDTFKFMHTVYGGWFHCDIALLAKMLDA